MLTFAFMHYPCLFCILFGMPFLHQINRIWRTKCTTKSGRHTTGNIHPTIPVFPPWPVAMRFATMHNSSFQKHYTFLFLPSLVFSVLLCICVFCAFIPRLLYLLQLKKWVFSLCQYLSSSALALIYKYCSIHSPEILFNNYCIIL